MTTEYIIFVIFFGVTYIIGVSLNSFIAAFTIKNRIRGEPQSPVDLILTVLGLSHVMIQNVQLFGFVAAVTVSDLLCSYKIYAIFTLFYALNLSSSWTTVWLCLFYCIKIVTFQHCLLMSLRLRLPTLVPRLLSGSVIVSFSYMALFTLITEELTPLFKDLNYTECNDQQQLPAKQFLTNINYAFDFGVSIASLLVLLSLGLTLTSLGSHVLRIHKGLFGISSSQLTAHINASRSIALFLILQIGLYVVQLISSTIEITGDTVWYWCISFILYSYSPLNALLLIMGNRKLRLACVFICSGKFIKHKGNRNRPTKM
ncbi:taste receptor type 2 member 41-like [Bombina bombina]|uniref:taste receptor type 2 member 41-like n=1 Tax=Bombina bombina TaxID=8345 RepID=UPI00235A8007|nr:taste receptor type 2 member 41-like [Bombina bombina]